MAEIIATLVELGRRLAGFGGNNATREIVRRAAAANPWFTPKDITRAVDAIRGQMLQPELLEKWLYGYDIPQGRKPLDVLVIAAGNIPLVGFADILCVVASGNRCLLKPSHKDSVLTGYICALLLEIDPGIQIRAYSGNEAPDAVIATGSDNTNRYFRAAFRGIPSLLRSGRGSVAVLDGAESDAALRLLADDVFGYSGLGCRNVSLIMVPAGYDAGRLIGAMKAYVGVNPHYRNNYRQRQALLSLEGAEFVDGGFFVATYGDSLPSAISEVVIMEYASVEDAAEWVARNEGSLQCIASGFFRHPRAVPVGTTQLPSLGDYADGRDTMEFLLTLTRDNV